MSDALGPIPPKDDRSVVDWLTRIWIGCSQIDECWLERGARGLRWWPHDYAQTLWVEAPRSHGDTLAWRVLVETEIADLVDGGELDLEVRLFRGASRLREARLRSALWQHRYPTLGSLVVVENRSGVGAPFKLVDRGTAWVIAGVDGGSLMALLALGSGQLLRSWLIRDEIAGSDPIFRRTVSTRRDGIVREEPDGLFRGNFEQATTLIPRQDVWDRSLDRCEAAIGGLGGRSRAVPEILLAAGSFAAAAERSESAWRRQFRRDLMCTLPQSEGAGVEPRLLGHAKLEATVPLKRLPFEPGTPEVAIELALRESAPLGVGCLIRSTSPFPQLLDSRPSTFSDEVDESERERVSELLSRGDHRNVPRLAKFAERVRALDHFAVQHEPAEAGSEAESRVDGLGGWSMGWKGLTRQSFLPAATCVNVDLAANVVRGHVLAHRWARLKKKRQLDSAPIPHALEHHP